MILLDTNVISEPLKPGSDPNVLAWIDAQTMETLFVSTITLAELRFGIAVMPEGKRKSVLQRRLEEEVIPLFDGRVLSFDEGASKAYAEVRARARAAGKAIGTADAYIAAVAVAHGFSVATRDTSPFEAAGCEFINPWEVGREHQ
ncbi:type II toxin-antitoxin system VapC family toxin [Hydrogenophaga sp.]|uniref:type II toxin-antitoxin system VapC family toxin n=1 Tax=Hydrogenophaga sp. TaxID=1904254 RepID=UPI003BAF6DC6